MRSSSRRTLSAPSSVRFGRKATRSGRQRASLKDVIQAHAARPGDTIAVAHELAVVCELVKKKVTR